MCPSWNTWLAGARRRSLQRRRTTQTTKGMTRTHTRGLRRALQSGEKQNVP